MPAERHQAFAQPEFVDQAACIERHSDLDVVIEITIHVATFQRSRLARYALRIAALSPCAPRPYPRRPAIQRRFEDLRAAGALNANVQDTTLYRYEPRTPELQTLIDQLAALYAHNLVGVTHLIHSKLNKKAQQFADAFKWQKDT